MKEREEERVGVSVRERVCEREQDSAGVRVGERVRN